MIFYLKFKSFNAIVHFIDTILLAYLLNLFLLSYLKILKIYLIFYLLIGFLCFTHFIEYNRNLIMSATVNIHTHFDYPSSQTNNSSTPSLINISIAFINDTYLSIEHITEFIDMQSYALFSNRIYEIRLLRVS